MPVSPTPLADRVRRIASHLIEDCRLAVDYEAQLLDVADAIEALEAERPRCDMEIPKDKNYPSDAAQCGNCGGYGCPRCQDLGWVRLPNKWARRCFRETCGQTLTPASPAVYCSVACAMADA